MGDAKKRGTFEERKSQAIQRNALEKKKEKSQKRWSSKIGQGTLTLASVIGAVFGGLR